MKKKRTKGELLEHYAEREPTAFYQFDGWHLGVGHGDDVMHPDEEGDCLASGTTYELMHGADVRVLVKRGMAPEIAAQLLEKLTSWIRRDGFEFHEEQFLSSGPPEDDEVPF
jgi:hypothetical protein